MKKRTIVLLRKWILRIVLYCVLIYALCDLGMDTGPSILGATMFIAFWIWYFYIDDVENPVMRQDANE